MIKWLKNLLTLQDRFEELQRQHDLRAVLNTRLHKQNIELTKELNRRRAQSVKPKEQRDIEKVSAKYVEHRTMMRIEAQRQNITIDKLRDYVSEAQFLAICDETNGMTDEQVLAYRKSKRAGR